MLRLCGFLRRGCALLVGGAIMAGVATSARADDAEREGKFDLFLTGQYSLSDEVETSFGPDAEWDSTWGLGGGIGTNLNDHVNLNVTVIAGEINTSVDTFFGSFESDGTYISPEANLDVYFFDADLTPFVTGGAGAMILTGDGDETAFSYGVGAGVRWDFSETAFLKAYYRAKWFELDLTEDPFMLSTFNIAIGIMR